MIVSRQFISDLIECNIELGKTSPATARSIALDLLPVIQSRQISYEEQVYATSLFQYQSIKCIEPVESVLRSLTV